MFWTRNQRAPALYYLWCTIYSPHDPHYICFSLVVESGHKKLSLTLSLGLCVRTGAVGVKWVLKLWQLVKILRGKWDFRPIYDHHLYVRGHFGGPLNTHTHTYPSSPIEWLTTPVVQTYSTLTHPIFRVLYHKNRLNCGNKSLKFYTFLVLIMKCANTYSSVANIINICHKPAFLSAPESRSITFIGHWFPLIMTTSSDSLSKP